MKTIISKSKKPKMTTKKSEVSDVSVAVIDYIISVANGLDLEDVESFKTELLSKQKGLDSIICTKMSKQKLKKDVNRPKRGKSSYIFFCMDVRETIKEENPDLKAKDVTKELGRVWKEETSEDDKIKYNELAARDKERYEKEMVTYVPPVGTKTKKKKKVTTGPKRPRSGYILFCNDKRGELKETTELSSKEIISELGRQWREIKPKQKEHYMELAATDKERYLREKEEFKSKEDSEEKVEEKVEVVKKGKSKCKDKGKCKEEVVEKQKSTKKRGKRGKKKT